MIRIKSSSPIYGKEPSSENRSEPLRVQKKDEYSIYLLLDGTIHFRLAKEQQTLRPQSLLIVYPGEEYSIGSSTPELFCQNISFSLKDTDELCTLLRDKLERVNTLPNKCLKMTELLDFNDKGLSREAMLSMSHIVEALLYALIDSKLSQKPVSSTYESYVEDSINFMKKHVFDKVTVNDISDALGVCGYHYIRLFKQVTGVTPMHYFLKLKTTKAAELLKVTNMPISEIAERLHFSSDAHFSRTFKRHMFYTPSIYRRQSSLVTEKYTFNDMLLQTIIDSSPDLIFFKDTNFVLLGCNAAFCTVLGLDRSQIVGKRDADLFPHKEALFFNQIDKAILESGKPQSNSEWMTFPDGTQKRYEVMKAPFYDESDTIAGIVGISRELAKKKYSREHKSARTVIEQQEA